MVATDAVLEEPDTLPHAGSYRGHEDGRRFGAQFNTVLPFYWDTAAVVNAVTRE